MSHDKSHAHDGADGSGTVAHSATTGRTANDHHNQAHTDSDHSDGANVKASTLAGLFKIAEVDLSGAAANIDISSIPATYLHLELVGWLRSDRSGAAGDDIVLSLNNDTTDADYDSQYLQGNVTATVAQFMGVAGSRFFGRACAATAPANNFGEIRARITNYASTTANKLVHGITSIPTSRSANGLFVRQHSLYWASTAAINRITLAPSLGSNFLTGSKVSLYGILAGA